MGIEEYLPKIKEESPAQKRYERSFQIGERLTLNDGREWEVRGSTAIKNDGSETVVCYTVRINPKTKKQDRLELTAEELSKRIVDYPLNHAA